MVCIPFYCDFFFFCGGKKKEGVNQTGGREIEEKNIKNYCNSCAGQFAPLGPSFTHRRTSV